MDRDGGAAQVTEEPAVRKALAKALQRVGQAIERLDGVVGKHMDDLTWEEAALLLRHVRHEVSDVLAVAEALERYIITERRASGIWQDVEVPGVGVVAVHRAKNRKEWDHESLAGLVLDKHLTELEGEIPDPWEVRRWLTDAAGIGYWRVGVLRALGIDPDEHSTTTRGRVTVQIIGGPREPGDLS